MIVDTLNQIEELFDIDVPTFMKYITDYQFAYNRGGGMKTERII